MTENDELTTRGFVTIHEAQMQQEGEEEIKTLFNCLGFSPALEPINNCLIKLEFFVPESHIQVNALPVQTPAQFVTILKSNSELIRVDNLPSGLRLFKYIVPG